MAVCSNDAPYIFHITALLVVGEFYVLPGVPVVSETCLKMCKLCRIFISCNLTTNFNWVNN
jgi:hypothetical protein